MSRRVRYTLVTVLLLLVVLTAAGYFMFGDQIQAVNSIREIADGVFYLEYRGDYGVADFLEQGGAASDAELTAFLTKFFTKGLYQYEPPEQLIGCSTIAAQLPDGGYGFGRNFDLDDSTVLIMRTVPEDGYASISTTNQNTDKLDLTTTSALRLILDRAANVEEALALLEQYDMHASADSDYHFALSDASGRAVVVEYIDDKMHVLETPVVTNHILLPSSFYKIGLNPGDTRYEVLMEYWEDRDWVMTLDETRAALAAAAQSGGIKTLWSIVYDQSALKLAFYHRRDFDNPIYFNLTER